MIEYSKLFNLKNQWIFKIYHFENLKKNIKCYNLANLKKINFTIWKNNISQLEKLLNCANNWWIMKK